MSKLQWGAVGAVLILGIVSQIPRHDHAHMPGHEHADHAQDADMDAAMSAAVMPADGTVPAGRERVLLTISGMT